MKKLSYIIDNSTQAGQWRRERQFRHSKVPQNIPILIDPEADPQINEYHGGGFSKGKHCAEHPFNLKKITREQMIWNKGFTITQILQMRMIQLTGITVHHHIHTGVIEWYRQINIKFIKINEINKLETF